MYTSTSYFLTCKLAKLTLEDLQFMTIGMCFDHIAEYAEFVNPESKEKEARVASQADMDRF